MRSRLDSVADWEAEWLLAARRIGVLAKNCGITERHLRRHFLLRFEEPPRRWFEERRVARAAASLLQGKLAKEVAAEAGYKSPAHFTRLFTQQFGVPPSAFRLAEAISRSASRLHDPAPARGSLPR